MITMNATSGSAAIFSNMTRRLAEAGVAVPDFALLTGDFDLDPDRFGPIVMIKPTGFTSHGRGIEMVQTAAMAGSRWRDHPAVRAADTTPMVVQRFIDTGEYPSHYRIVTLFSEPIFAFRAVSTVRRPSLDAEPEALTAGPFMAKHGQRRLIVPVEADVLDLSRRTFGAISEVALHGCDIIRESGTGHLFVLEINPGGNTWSFSSKWAALLRTELNMPDLSTQFDAWKTCARILVQRTRLEAM
jgi:predicted ATP-grasp superfamily ATP-dependent carboligase